MLNSSEIFLAAALVPLAGAIILAVFQRQLKTSAPYLATGFILLSLAATIFGLVEHMSHSMTNGGLLAHAPWLPWIGMASRGTTLSGAAMHHANMIADPLTAMMFVIILVLAVPGQIFLTMYLNRRDEPPCFYALICLLIFAALATCLSSNLLSLVAFAYFAAIIGSLLSAGLTRPGHGIAAWPSLTMISAGMAFFLLALAVLDSRTGLAGGEFFSRAGTWAIGPHLEAALGVESYRQVLHFRGGPYAAGLNFLTWAGVGFLFFGLALMGQFPFQAWPLETLEAPAPINGLLIGAVLPLLGIYIIARLYPYFTLDARLIMAIAGGTTMVTAVFSAWAQTDIKRMTWWMISGEFGWCVLLFGAGAWVQALFHAILWASLAMGFFLVGGAVLGCTGGRRDVRMLGGLWKKLPVTAGAALVFVLIGSGVIDVVVPGELPRALLWLHRYGNGLEGFGRLLYWIPLAALGVNSLVLWRWWWLVFGGLSRDSDGATAVTRESAVLTLPLVLITVLTVGLHEPFFGIKSLLAHAAPRTFISVGHHDGAPIVATPQWPMQLWLPPAGAIAALLLYFRGFALAERLRRIPGINLLYIWFHGEFFLREISLVIPGLLLKGLSLAAKFVDRIVLELLLVLTALFLRVAGMLVDRMELAWSTGIWDRLAAVPAPRRVVLFFSAGRVRGGLVILISAGLVAAAILMSMALA